MSERDKEFAGAIVFFALAVLLGAYAVLGELAFGAMSLLNTRQFCAVWSLGCVAGGALWLIGDQKLNEWINPRLEAYSEKRRKVKEQRKVMQAKLDSKYPDRVAQRERRKKLLCSIAGWALLISPIIAIVTSIILICFKTEICYTILVISVFYAIQIWSLLLKAF